ncbi:MAG: LuxR family transcriptional regulator [Rubrivivax sp.]|nr:MAG: LuxR family transcriptional regulator [Rubrivivax sp.]
MAAVVGSIGEARFAASALNGLNEGQLRAASWAVYELRPEAAPVLHLSASVGIADTTRDCFAAYLGGLYQRDRSFDGVSPGHAAVLRMHADEAPTRDHREAIYRRHGVLERLSVVQRADDRSLLAVNLYHHEHQGRFTEGEVAGFAEAAPVLLAAVQRHLRMTGPGQGVPADARQALRLRCPALTDRELDVCERLLRGWSYDGIAADLGLSLATVKTYRARAFERLGMHFKSELFAAFLPRH